MVWMMMMMTTTMVKIMAWKYGDGLANSAQLSEDCQLPERINLPPDRTKCPTKRQNVGIFKRAGIWPTKEKQHERKIFSFRINYHDNKHFCDSFSEVLYNALGVYFTFFSMHTNITKKFQSTPANLSPFTFSPRSIHYIHSMERL